ncbi:7-cyano-7-deazaguanine synthase [Kitasatospora sp. NPDC086801]|uniref:7-cyano-7-deazaguanine synthase n=1 Tax=Kitasatospora sp. NPDC086801 TaxID=3364066 RepID=UPI0038248741
MDPGERLRITQHPPHRRPARRPVHPHHPPLFLQTLAAIAKDAGAHADIHNPFATCTKGEMFRQAAELIGPAPAAEFLSRTHSCAHTGHRSYRIPVRTHCGVCFGCLLRRASFLAANLQDATGYLHTRHDENLQTYLRNKSVELLPPAAAPSADYAAVLLDDQDTVWAEVPTSDGREDLVLPPVYAREEAVSRRDFAEQGGRLTHIGWAR